MLCQFFWLHHNYFIFLIVSTFERNSGSNAVIAITNFPFVLQGKNRITKSEGPAIMVCHVSYILVASISCFIDHTG